MTDGRDLNVTITRASGVVTIAEGGTSLTLTGAAASAFHDSIDIYDAPGTRTSFVRGFLLGAKLFNHEGGT